MNRRVMLGVLAQAAAGAMAGGTRVEAMAPGLPDPTPAPAAHSAPAAEPEPQPAQIAESEPALELDLDDLDTPAYMRQGRLLN